MRRRYVEVRSLGSVLPSRKLDLGKHKAAEYQELNRRHAESKAYFSSNHFELGGAIDTVIAVWLFSASSGHGYTLGTHSRSTQFELE